MQLHKKSLGCFLVAISAVWLAGCATREADSAEVTIRGFNTCTAAKPQQLLGKDGTVFTCGIRDGRFRFRFEVVDSDVCVATKVKHPLDLAGGDRVEVYFVPDAKMEKGYRCAEIDASGRVLSYSVDEKKNFDWFWRFATLESVAERTADGYTVAGSVSVDELKSFGIDPASFYLGVFRAEMSAPDKTAKWCSAAPLVLPAHFHQPAMLFPFKSTNATVSTEARYDFRKRLSAPRELRQHGFAGDPIAKDETVLDDRWTLVVESDEPVVKHAAADLRDFLEKRCGARCAGTDGKKRIVVAVSPEKNPLTSRITASENEIRVTGATPREAAQGCYRLEDELTRRDQPAVKRGTRTYTRMFSPRMTHSGYEIEKFPDWHMDQIAHAGMDAILVYVTDPPDMTRNGREDFNALVKRAAEHGLDVYAYLDRWGKPIEKHPLDPGAEEYYDQLFGSVVKNAPGLKGMILVGESCSFPSRDEGVYGYAWEGAGIKPDPAHPKKGCNGFWPASDWKECLELISKVTRKYNPDFDLVFWTYNWARAPEKDRLAMLERIPTNVTLHVTFELGDKPVEKLGVRTMLDDYSISRPGPSETFTGEASVAGRRGIKLSSMTNTGGRTWDFGAIPFEPVPYCWMKRYRALREAKEKYGLKALMDEHHYGFAPNFVADLAKCAFTEETTEADLDACLRSLAECQFGRRNADAVLAAWKDWSDAMEWHAARDFDQYGVLRVGPTYPFAFYGEKIPDPPQCLGDEPGHPGGKWIYVWGTAGMKWGRIEPHEIAPYLEMNRKELALWRRGNERLAGIKDIPSECRETARRLIGLGKYCEHTLRSSCNVKRYWLAGLNKAGKDEIAKILKDETENVKGLIPYVEADSQLGWEPSMRYVTDAPCLRWKLQQLELSGRRLQFGEGDGRGEL